MSEVEKLIGEINQCETHESLLDFLPRTKEEVEALPDDEFFAARSAWISRVKAVMISDIGKAGVFREDFAHWCRENEHRLDGFSEDEVEDVERARQARCAALPWFDPDKQLRNMHPLGSA